MKKKLLMNKITGASPQFFLKKTFHSLALVSFSLSTPVYAKAPIASDDKKHPTYLSTTNQSTRESIIVIGEKTNKSLFDTSASITVFDANEIDSLPKATEISDLLQLTANITDTGINNTPPTIRGVSGAGPLEGANAFFSGNRPRLNLSIDGRSFTYNELAFGPQSLWDIKQVEIFKGPQSHIQGRNAIAGAIVITSKDPTFHWESTFRGGIAQQDYRQTAAMLSGPLIQDQLAMRLSVDRQARFSYGRMLPYQDVGDPREIEMTTLRGKILFKPQGIPGLSTQLTFNRYDGQVPQGEANGADNPNAGISIYRPVQETTSINRIWDLSWEISNYVTFENKLIHTHYDLKRTSQSPHPNANTKGKEWHIEPLIRFNLLDSQLKGILGGRYFNNEQDDVLTQRNLIHPFKDKTKTHSIYTSMTYAIHPQFDVTVAGRYEREHRMRHGGINNLRFSSKIKLDKTYTAFLPKLDLAWKPSTEQIYGFSVTKGFNAGGAGVSFAAPIESYTYDSESVWNYEFYTRHTLYDKQLSFTTNIFYNDYKQMQLPYRLSQRSSKVVNANKVQTYGAEIGSRWLIMPQLELFTNIGLLKTQIKRFSDKTVEGNKLPTAPKHTFAIGANYRFLDNFNLNGNMSNSGSYFSEYDNDTKGKVSPYWSANLQLGYDFDYGKATIYAKNLLNSNKNIIVLRNDTDSPTKQRPRMIGAMIELKF